MSSLLFALAVLLDLRDLQSTVRPAGVHDFRSSPLLYRGDQSLHGLYVHVFGADLQRRTWEPISHAFSNTRSLALRQVHSVQTEPRQILKVREDRLDEHVLHLHLLRAVGDDQSVRLEETQVAQLQVFRDLSHRLLAVLQRDSPEIDPQGL